jgi:phosphatidylcholine synthase
VLASAYGFCRTDAKTADHYFTGFPSYWNIVAFYLYALGWPPALNAAVVIALSIAVFVPIRYVYPSRTTTLRALTVGLGLAWGAFVLYALAHLDTVPRPLVAISLAYPAYYVLLSLALQARRS